MIQLSVSEIAKAIGGTVQGDGQILVTGAVETDSRVIAAGGLFVAKPGAISDGHHFLPSAQKAGAVAAIVERFVPESDLAQIQVADSVKALGLLAKHVLASVRAETGIQVIGITGSNGKTTTKNMLHAILSVFGETVAPIESYNNVVGAPVSILKIDRRTRFLVAELGAAGRGSIRYLADIVRPDVAVELKVGMAHSGEFGGIEVTAEIKAELLEFVSPSGAAVLNADDAWVRQMASKTVAPITWFGTAPAADIRASELQSSIDGTSFKVEWPDGESRRLTLRIIGEHHAMNALAALAVVENLGLDRAKAVQALESVPLAERWRMQLIERSDGVTVINDAYNASPESTKAALQTLAHFGKSGRRTIAVLGEMAELGEFSRQEHDSLGRLAVRLNIDELIVIGEKAKLIHLGAMQEGSWDGESKFFDSIATAFAHLRGMLAEGDIVLVKSSKSANLRFLGDAIGENADQLPEEVRE